MRLQLQRKIHFAREERWTAVETWDSESPWQDAEHDALFALAQVYVGNRYCYNWPGPYRIECWPDEDDEMPAGTHLIVSHLHPRLDVFCAEACDRESERAAESRAEFWSEP